MRTSRIAPVLVTTFVAAGAAVASLSAVSAPTIRFTDTRLKNGLRVIVSENRAAPVFSLVVVYNAGSRDERIGRTGFAHLFEHMMFKGSDNVADGEHFYTVVSNGGTMNGTTNKERTLYYETMPANQLDAALFLEADRMRSLAMTRENLDNQRNAVQEERRLRVDNQPYGRTDEALDELAFDNAAYKHSVVGSMADLTAASVEDVAAFFTAYYAPNNAIVAIVGDVRPADALERVRRHFEAIPAQSPPPLVDVSQPAQDKERRLTVDDPLARLPRLDIGYRIPSSLSADDDSIDVIAEILAGGRSGRLYEYLVREKALAVSVAAFAGRSRGPRLLRIQVTPAAGTSLADLEREIDAQIDGVKAGPIADAEIEKGRNTARRDVVASVSTSLSLARTLAEDALYDGDPGRINSRWERAAKVSAADVQRVARQHLTRENRTVVITQPQPTPAAPAGGRP